MSFHLTKKSTVGELAARFPRTKSVLQSMGIDYSFAGDKTLEAVSVEKGIALEELKSAIREAIKAEQTSTEADEALWMSESLAELIDYIEEHHHMFLKEQFQRIQTLFRKVIKSFPQHGAILVRLEEVFDLLRSETDLHLLKEEHIIFPHIRQVEAYSEGRGTKPEFQLESIEGTTHYMVHDHENVMNAFKRMRKISQDYELPKDADETFRSLFEALKALEKDHNEHVHLENNILFPRANDLEKTHLIA